MSNESYRIPQDVDAPIPIFAWEMTEVVVAIMVIGVGIIMRFYPRPICGDLSHDDG
ncbi:hypothetical protein HSBAA_PA_3430 (plasmid) [Vreelandella sulfidaeris]|uniref:Uncharacterized protein n=1 Tax=Vreelandella sulfidaeris TaxID=115553 RepID=A0A455UHP0_9GAMM|nr:hypothetical protein HSBAA_PA_3430 [Halomonas sulfidaeris]